MPRTRLLPLWGQGFLEGTVEGTGSAPGKAGSPTAVCWDVWAVGSLRTPGTSSFVWGRKPFRLEPQRQQKRNNLRAAGLSQESPSVTEPRCVLCAGAEG